MTDTDPSTEPICMGCADLAAQLRITEALAESLADRVAAQAELLEKSAELRRACVPIVTWVGWGENWPAGKQPDDAPIVIGCQVDPKYVLRLSHLRRIAALAADLGVTAPGPVVPQPIVSPPPASAAEKLVGGIAASTDPPRPVGELGPVPPGEMPD